MSDVEEPSASLQPAPLRRRAAFAEALHENQLDMGKLKNMAFMGIPEELRAVYWKILLGLLPSDTTLWESTLERRRALYRSYVDEFLVDPHKSANAAEGTSTAAADHPLSTSSDSKWSQFFANNDLLQEINKDVLRTYPDMQFFSRGPEAKDALRRILFVYAKLNPGVKYVQGMNELLAPLFYIFCEYDKETSQEHAEADAFFCFTMLMSEFMDLFIKSLDRADSGILACIADISSLLKQKDPHLWSYLDAQGLNPQFYLLRWLTALLAQELGLPDLLRVWDSLFASRNRFEFLKYFCISMIISVRDKLLHGTFAENMDLLQHYPPGIDILDIIDMAVRLKQGGRVSGHQ